MIARFNSETLKEFRRYTSNITQNTKEAVTAAAALQAELDYLKEIGKSEESAADEVRLKAAFSLLDLRESLPEIQGLMEKLTSLAGDKQIKEAERFKREGPRRG